MFSIEDAKVLSQRRLAAEELCRQTEARCSTERCGVHRRLRGLAAGGWCLAGLPLHALADARNRSQLEVSRHVPADPGIVPFLRRLLRPSGSDRSFSLNDLGAGVGQYAASLLELETDIRYKGYPIDRHHIH